MAQNVAPVYTGPGNISWSKITTANTATDGTGTTVTLFTASATNGSAADRADTMHLGTNVATVLRVFINNGSTPATAANNTLWRDITIGANTVSQTAQSILYELLLLAGSLLRMPPGYKLLGTIGTTVATGIQVTTVGGDY